jgi:cytochrome c oxidase subunit II
LPGTNSANTGRVPALVVWTIGLAVVAAALSRQWLPALASQHGAGVDRMLRYTMLTTGLFIVLGHLVLGCLLWRFGGRDLAASAQNATDTGRRWPLAIAAVVALIAEGGVFALGLPVWNQSLAATAPANSLAIEVTAEQFGWNVRYPGPDGIFGRTDPKLITLDNPLGMDPTDPHGKDDLIGLNVLHAVVNRPVKIRLRSKDVIHGFFLPNLRVKQDAVPGMTIEFWFTPDRTGRFEVACTQLCGFGHYEMKAVLIVQSAEEFAAWVREQGNG